MVCLVWGYPSSLSQKMNYIIPQGSVLFFNVDIHGLCSACLFSEGFLHEDNTEMHS